MNSTHFFDGETIVELAGVLAGPLVGRFFAEHGAHVIKLENPHAGGDVTRGWRTREEESIGISAYYASVNQGKESRMIDLKSEVGIHDLEVLLRDASVLLTNFRPIDFQRFNVSFDSIRMKFPQLIIGQIDGFGSNDNRPAYDMVLQAESGFLSMSGTPEGSLVKMPVALIDVLAGQHLKSGILMAMLHRERTGQGSLVRVSLLDAALSSLVNQSAAFLKTGQAPKPMGTLHPSIAPYGECFEAGDGKKFILAIGSDGQFEDLLEICKLDEIKLSGQFKTNKQRVDHREALFQTIAPCFKVNTRAYWMQELLQKGIPAGAILGLDEVLAGEHAQTLLVKCIQEGQELISIRTSPLKFE